MLAVLGEKFQWKQPFSTCLLCKRHRLSSETVPIFCLFPVTGFLREIVLSWQALMFSGPIFCCSPHLGVLTGFSAIFSCASLRETVRLELMTSMLAFLATFRLHISQQDCICDLRRRYYHCAQSFSSSSLSLSSLAHFMSASAWRPLPLFSNFSYPTLFVSTLCHQISLSHPSIELLFFCYF